MKSISEINTGTIEGKIALMSLAALTCSPVIHVNGKELNGQKMQPDEMLNEILCTVDKVYTESNKKYFEDNLEEA